MIDYRNLEERRRLIGEGAGIGGQVGGGGGRACEEGRGERS